MRPILPRSPRISDPKSDPICSWSHYLRLLAMNLHKGQQIQARMLKTSHKSEAYWLLFSRGPLLYWLLFSRLLWRLKKWEKIIKIHIPHVWRLAHISPSLSLTDFLSHSNRHIHSSAFVCNLCKFFILILT